MASKDQIFQANKDCLKLRETYEAQAILKFINLLYDAVRDDMLKCSTEKLGELRVYAIAYRDLLEKLTKPIIEIPTGAPPETE